MLELKLPAEVFWAGGRLDVWKTKAPGPNWKKADAMGRTWGEDTMFP